MKIKPAIFFLLLFFPACITAQQEQPLHFEKIEGLSQNTVYSILEDKQGFMWIATANGLNRFDGVEMKAYKSGIENTVDYMKGRIIRSALLEDNEEKIWFASDLSINCFDKKQQKFTQYKLYVNETNEQSKEQKAYSEMFANPLLKKDDYVWFASAIEGLFAINIKTRKCINYPVKTPGEKGDNIPLMYNAAFDGKEKLWFASVNGLLCFDINSRMWSRFLEGNSFYSVSLSNDTLYLGINENIRWFDTKSLKDGDVLMTKTPAYIHKGLVRRVYTDEKKNVWTGDQAGNIFCKTIQQNSFVWKGNINGNTGSKTNYPVYCLYTDATGNLWVGADVLGLLKAETDQNVFNYYPNTSDNTESSQNLFIYSIYEDEKENIWLGTFQNGLIILNKTTGQTRSVSFPYYDPKLPYGKSVPLVKKDKYGNIWTSYCGRLYVKENNREEFTSIQFPIPDKMLQSPQLWNMAEYNNGWLLATNIGVYFVEKKNDRYVPRIIDGFRGTKVVDIWVSPTGQVWIAAETSGIFIYTSLEDHKTRKRLFASENIKSMRYDESHQLLWISSVTGLIAYHIPTEKYKAYKEEEGLQSSLVYGILQNNNEIWLSTNDGLSKGTMEFNERSVFPQISFVNFTKEEGLMGSEFNSGAFNKGSSGNFYFGSTQGVVWFKPGEVKSKNTRPKLQLINFLVNEQNADSLVAPEYISSVSLPYTKNSLFFRFRGIDFDKGKKIKYKYQLESWDKNWIYSNTLNEVRYNNLPYGKYLFRIKATGASGIWTDEERTVSIIINPPFWKTWWFYSLTVLLIAGFIVILTRRFAQRKLRKQLAELEKQRELDKERLRISREMHDDIGAGLTQITLMSESAKNKLGVTGNKELDDIGGTSRKLVSNMSEIIWSLNPENKTLDQLWSYLREQLNKQLEYSGMEYSIQLPEQNENITLSNEQRRNILLVTKEIVNNAIKYSKATNIDIKASLENGKISFSIQDDGVGFDTSRKLTGNGLKNIYHRIKELDGELKAESESGKGSSFIYTIPLKRRTT